MKRAQFKREGKSAFELVEESVHLLRSRPAKALASYYVGALPFVLGLLYFWTDMSRSAFAEQHLAESSLGVAALFLWMKWWQSMFARQLLGGLLGRPEAMTARRCARVAVAQTAFQSTGFLLLPLAAIFMLPFAWVYAFYQNVTAFGADDSGSTAALFKRAVQQSRLWPRQNHLLMTVLFGFSVFVFLNWATFVLLLPLALKTLFGLQSAYSRSPLTMLNTTFFAIVAGLTYLTVDPLAKASYVLRCFYGEALNSGADLRSELNQLKAVALKPGLAALALAILLPLLPATGLCQPAEPPAATPVSASEVAPGELDRTISDVLKERKYTWRAPREKLATKAPAERGIIGRFLDSVAETLKGWAEKLGGWLDRMLRKLFRQPVQSLPQPSGFGWMTRLHLLMYALAAAALVAIFLLAWKLWQRRQASTRVVDAEPIQPVVDLADENVAADQLPEDGWTKLAHELLQRGELRLALRAFYLASLAHLAARNLLTIARFKSNRDYERELTRRGHSWPEVLSRFKDNVAVFDRVWYGAYPVDGQLVNGFAGNVEAIRTAASSP